MEEKMYFISDLKAGKINLDTLTDELEKQKEEIDQQIHIAHVVNAAYRVDDLIKNNIFTDADVFSLNFMYQHDYDEGYALNFYWKYRDGHGTGESFSHILHDAFEPLRGFNTEYLNAFKEDESFEICVDEKFVENFLNKMLSKELQAKLLQSELNSELPINEDNHKRAKI